MDLKVVPKGGLVALAFAILTGCNTTSFCRREVTNNPLPRMEAFAKDNGYKVIGASPSALRVEKNVNGFMMVLGFRRDKFVGSYRFGEGLFEAETWVDMCGLWGYGITSTHELKPQFAGALITPQPRRCANELMRAGGMREEWP